MLAKRNTVQADILSICYRSGFFFLKSGMIIFAVYNNWDGDELKKSVLIKPVVLKGYTHQVGKREGMHVSEKEKSLFNI